MSELVGKPEDRFSQVAAHIFSHLLYNFDQIFENCSSPTLVGNNCCSQIPQNVGTHGLYGIQIPEILHCYTLYLKYYIVTL